MKIICNGIRLVQGSMLEKVNNDAPSKMKPQWYEKGASGLSENLGGQSSCFANVLTAQASVSNELKLKRYQKDKHVTKKEKLNKQMKRFFSKPTSKLLLGFNMKGKKIARKVIKDKLIYVAVFNPKISEKICNNKTKNENAKQIEIGAR